MVESRNWIAPGGHSQSRRSEISFAINVTYGHRSSDDIRTRSEN